MADVSVPLAHERVEPAQARVARAERFLTWPRVGGVAAFVLFALTFNDGGVHDDGAVYFDFLRRFFGVPTGGTAYQFGSAVWNAPFWLVSQLVAVRGGFDHFRSGEVGVNASSVAAVVVTLYVGWRILHELGLPRGPSVLMLTVFGTPLFYYGALVASYKHAADALYATVLFWFVLRSLRSPARRVDYMATGASLGLLVATRYANVAFSIAVIGMFLVLRRRSAAVWTAGALVVASAVLFTLPTIRHIPYASPPGATYGMGATKPDLPAVLAEPAHRVADGSFLSPVTRHSRFGLTVPLKMLFTLHRGLFVFTPLTAFAVVGFVLLLLRDRPHRAFLATLGVSALALLGIHSFWSAAWDGGGSFSERFLTALFPFFLVGAAELVRRWRVAATTVLSLCAAWSLWIGLVEFNGYYNENASDGIVQVVSAFKGFTGPPVSRFHQPPPYNSLENFGRQVGDRISSRWQFYWRLVT